MDWLGGSEGGMRVTPSTLRSAEDAESNARPTREIGAWGSRDRDGLKICGECRTYGAWR